MLSLSFATDAENLESIFRSFLSLLSNAVCPLVHNSVSYSCFLSAQIREEVSVDEVRVGEISPGCDSHVSPGAFEPTSASGTRDPSHLPVYMLIYTFLSMYL